MTREEAIADIKNNIKPVVGGKSLDMAIEALTLQNLTEPNNTCEVDLISINNDVTVEAIKEDE